MIRKLFSIEYWSTMSNYIKDNTNTEYFAIYFDRNIIRK